MEFNAILFDLDGTLLDSVPVILKASREAYAQMGMPYDEALVRKSIGLPLEVQACRDAPDRYDEFLETYREIYRKYEGRAVRLFPDTLAMLDIVRSRGFTMGIVTSKSARGAQRAIQQTGMAGKFQVVVAADDVRRPKPHPEPILAAPDTLEASPDRAVYVGDSLYDVDAAQKACVKMVGVSWGARSPEDLAIACADLVFDTWWQFLDWLGTPDGQVV